jgi:two-component system sensor histidine kinase UhpB
LAQLLGIREGITTPLAAGDRIYGVLIVTGSGLSGEDVPAISAFADQTAIAIQNAELLDAVDQQREELRRLSTHLMHAQERERRTIAQELHDETGQALTALSIDLAEIETTLSPDLPPAAAERLAESRMLTDRTLEQIRELSLSLRPSLLDDLGLLPALRWYIKRYARRTNVAVQFETEGMGERLSYSIETALYRVVLEALTNVARHARAEHVEVRLLKSDAQITAVIQDDGRGFDPKARAGHDVRSYGVGLLGMRERVRTLGGTLRVDSQLGQGTCITAEIPIKDRPQA